MNTELKRRKLTISGYSHWTNSLVSQGWTPYFVNFMFNSLPKRRYFQPDPMEDAADRVYRTLITRVVRNPKASGERLPIFWGCHDFPVFKINNVASRDNVVNSGRHYNGMYFIPPQTRTPDFDLVRHFDQNRRKYLGKDCLLQRIHTTRMTYGDMTDYALKAFKSGKIGGDDILVLPRASSELLLQQSYVA